MLLLRERIRHGEYAPGSRLPSESDLARELKVSRGTIRLALSQIETLGLIVRKQGDGTYVRRQVVEIDTQLRGIWDFRHLIEASHRMPSVQALSTTRRLLTADEAAALNTRYRIKVLALERLFLADEQPIIYSLNLIPVSLLRPQSRRAADGDTSAFDVALPLYAFLKQYCHKTIAYSTSDISARVTSVEIAARLAIPPSQPILHFSDVFFGGDDMPLAYGLNHYNDKSLRMRVTRAWS